MADRELELNALSRYSKDSPRFVLEEYGSCEVPAGCGGVVLRWRNPDTGIPILMSVHVEGEYQAFLDGAPLTSGRPLVPFGDHALALVISNADPRHMLLIFAGVYDEADLGFNLKLSHPTGEHARILSAPDGTWRFTTTEPEGDAWMLPGFDDAGWSKLALNETRPPPDDPKTDWNRWTIEQLQKKGARGLGVAGPASRLRRKREAAVPWSKVWVRKRFILTRQAGERP
jgi:hypothetical protein